MRMRLPLVMTAGDTLSWEEPAATSAFPPADGWTLTYRLHRDGADIQLTADGSSGVFSVTAAAVQTAAWTAGEYAWAAMVARGAERVTLATGRATILPDPAAATGDIRTHAERVLDAIRAVIEGRATRDQESYSIAGRSLSRTSIDDLLKLEREYSRRVAAEKAARDSTSGPRGVMKAIFRGA